MHYERKGGWRGIPRSLDEETKEEGGKSRQETTGMSFDHNPMAQCILRLHPSKLEISALQSASHKRAIPN